MMVTAKELMETVSYAFVAEGNLFSIILGGKKSLELFYGRNHESTVNLSR